MNNRFFPQLKSTSGVGWMGERPRATCFFFTGMEGHTKSSPQDRLAENCYEVHGRDLGCSCSHISNWEREMRHMEYSKGQWWLTGMPSPAQASLQKMRMQPF